MTDAQRQQYLPAVRTFISVLKKDNLVILMEMVSQSIRLVSKSVMEVLGIV